MFLVMSSPPGSDPSHAHPYGSARTPAAARCSARAPCPKRLESDILLDLVPVFERVGDGLLRAVNTNLVVIDTVRPDAALERTSREPVESYGRVVDARLLGPSGDGDIDRVGDLPSNIDK